MAQTNVWNGTSNNNWSTAANWSLNLVPTANHNVVINTTADISINTPSNPTINSLTIGNNADVTFTSSGGGRTISIDNTGSGIAVGSSLTLRGSTGSGTRNMGIAFTGSGRTMAIAGTLVLTDAGEGTFYNATNSITTVTGAIYRQENSSITSTATNLLFVSGGRYRHGLNGNNIPTASWSVNSTCEITGVTNAIPGSLTQTFGNFTWNCLEQGSGLANLSGTLNVAGNFLMENGRLGVTASFFSTRSATIEIGGSFTIDNNSLILSDASVISSSSLTINVRSGFFMRGSGIIRSAGNAGIAATNINFSGTQVQNFEKTGGSFSETSSNGGTAINSVAILNNAIVDFGTSVLNGDADFSLAAGGKLITAHAQGLNTGTGGTIDVTGSKEFNSGADYEFRGAGTGVFVTSPAAGTARDIIVNRAIGTVTLSQSMTVSRRLYLQAGELHTSAGSVITVGSGANATGVPPLTENTYNSSSFVVGPIRVMRTDNDYFTFPTGKAGVGLLPIGLSGISGGSGTFEAQYNAVSSSTVGPVRTGVVHTDACQYWNLRKISGSGSGTVTMYWNEVSKCGSVYIINPLSVGIARATSANPADSPGNGWTSNGGTVTMPGSAGAAGNIQWALGSDGLTSTTMFAIASSNMAESPLPVMMDGFVAYLKNGGVKIDWNNLTEKDVISYQVERSANGRDYTVINEQEPKLNDNSKASYTAFDADPLPGTNYYRIHVIEKAGKFFYSKVLRVDINSSKKGFVMYPNPVTGREMKLQLSNLKIGPYQVKVVTVSGQLVYQRTVNNYGSATTVSVELPASLQSGMYTLNVSGSDYQESKNIIVR